MEGTKNHRGLIRRTFSELFEIISDRKGSYSYEMNVSIVEIYNEQIRDLIVNNKEFRLFYGKLLYRLAVLTHYL